MTTFTATQVTDSINIHRQLCHQIRQTRIRNVQNVEASAAASNHALGWNKSPVEIIDVINTRHDIARLGRTMAEGARQIRMLLRAARARIAP